MQQLHVLRKQMAEKYESCDQKEKPQVVICEKCKQDIHCNQICGESGLFHNTNKIIIGGNIFDKNATVFTSEQILSAINALRIKWQESRVKKVFINNELIANFQNFKKQKCGVLYGNYDSKNKFIFVQDIIEQNFEQEVKQNKIALSLGLQRVGIILSHPPRDKNDFTISGREIMLSAKEQSIYGDHCVLITVSHDNKTNAMEVCSWQVSEQCVNLYRTGAFLEINYKKNNKHLITSYPLEITKSQSMEKSSVVDTHWFFAPTAIGQFE